MGPRGVVRAGPPDGTVRAYTDPSGEIAEQYGFDAFGNLLRRDQFTLVKSGSQGYYRTFRQRLGHQGLFAERADSHTNARVLDAGVELWYQSRSRWYLAELGRFMVPDPNATGIPVVSGLAMLGTTAAGAPSGSFRWEEHYGDGWDIYMAYGANPVRAQDPTGLLFGGLLDTLGATATSMHMRATQNGVYAKMFWGGTINGAWGGFWGGINAGMNDQSVTAGFFSGALTGFANGALTVGVAGMGAQGVQLLAAVFSVGGVTAAVDAAVMGESPRDIAKAGLIGGIGNSVGVGLGKADSSALLDPRNQDAVESAIDILWPALEGWAKTLADTWGFW